MSAPTLGPFPITVRLRCGKLATIFTAKGETPWCYIGGLNKGAPLETNPAQVEVCQPECWRRDGRWLESGQPHALDILTVAVGVRESGEIIWAPYTPAAGAKGPVS